MAGKSNVRRTPRARAFAPARAEGPRGPVRGTCLSLSQGGLYFSGAQLPVGQSLELAVELPAPLGPIRAVGEVRYHLADDKGQGMGIRFTRLAQEHLARITQYVQEHAA